MKTIIIYWSGTGNTKAIAEEINKVIDTDLFEVSEATTELLAGYDTVLLGCPAMGDDELEDSVFLPFYEEAKPVLINKQIGLFGSYEWNDGGPWLDNWYKDATASGLNVVKTLRIYGSPTSQDQEEIEDFAKSFS